jgi:SAM-dependent methyltransferase
LGGDRKYRGYLRVQLRRSLSKRANDSGVGSRVLIDQIAEDIPPRGSRVLCVGCRNTVELNEFRARGFADVVGIDLYSQHPDILVMDMHDMTFADESFDVIFASHSLEHSYDLERVVDEIVRVARHGALVAVEVPVRGQRGDADLLVFGNVAELRDAFGRHVGEVLTAEERPSRSETNDQGTDVARLVFRIVKQPVLTTDTATSWREVDDTRR